jgi:hypothetical protein
LEISSKILLYQIVGRASQNTKNDEMLMMTLQLLTVLSTRTCSGLYIGEVCVTKNQAIKQSEQTNKQEIKQTSKQNQTKTN